jgi:hypothetical protein
MADFRMCSIEGCGKPTQARNLCNAHYKRWRKNGDPIGGRDSPGDLLQWLRAHADFNEEACLLWPFGRARNGYGVVRFNGKRTTASRVMCIMAHGQPALDGMEAAHLCGRGHEGCVNPQHMRWATHLENCADMVMHQTSNRGERNGSAKITESQARYIKNMSGKIPQKHIAQQFGISFQQVSAIQSEKQWAWLDV